MCLVNSESESESLSLFEKKSVAIYISLWSILDSSVVTLLQNDNIFVNLRVFRGENKNASCLLDSRFHGNDRDVCKQ